MDVNVVVDEYDEVIAQVRFAIFEFHQMALSFLQVAMDDQHCIAVSIPEVVAFAVT